jgi:hypothetical protein
LRGRGVTDLNNDAAPRAAGALDWTALALGVRRAHALELLDDVLGADRLVQVSRRLQIIVRRRQTRARGHQQHWNVGEQGIPQLVAAKVPAVHDRHHQIQQDHVASTLVLFEQPQRLCAVARAQHAVTGILQDACERFAPVGLVLDDEDYEVGAAGVDD